MYHDRKWRVDPYLSVTDISIPCDNELRRTNFSKDEKTEDQPLSVRALEFNFVA